MPDVSLSAQARKRQLHCTRLPVAFHTTLAKVVDCSGLCHSQSGATHECTSHTSFHRMTSQHTRCTTLPLCCLRTKQDVSRLTLAWAASNARWRSARRTCITNHQTRQLQPLRSYYNNSARRSDGCRMMHNQYYLGQWYPCRFKHDSVMHALASLPCTPPCKHCLGCNE